jgi:hypothetical protein
VAKQRSGFAVGMTMFAAFMLILIGAFQAVIGLAGIIEDEFFVVGLNYTFEFDATTWGWIHLIAGVIILFAGFGLFSGAVWARTLAVILATISAIANFVFLPVSPAPFWAIAVIAIDVIVIWALTVHGRDITE